MRYIALLLLSLYCIAANAQYCVWANNTSGDPNGMQVAWDIRQYSSTSLLTCGTWGYDYSDSTPNYMNIGADNFSSVAWYNYFLARYDTGGHLLWAKTFPTDSPMNNIYGCRSVADRDGNIYMVGSYSSRFVYLDSVTLTNTDTSGYSGDYSIDGFISKFTASGHLIWAIPVSGNIGGDDYAMDIVLVLS